MIGRRVEGIDDLELPGDYCLSDVSEKGRTRPNVFFLLPVHEGATAFDRPSRGSGLHRVASPPHTFRECEDASIEVRASIVCRDADGEYWHGFLDEGHSWRTC